MMTTTATVQANDHRLRWSESKGCHLTKSIEKDYVLVNSPFVSLEDFSEYLGPLLNHHCRLFLLSKRCLERTAASCYLVCVGLTEGNNNNSNNLSQYHQHLMMLFMLSASHASKVFLGRTKNIRCSYWDCYGLAKESGEGFREILSKLELKEHKMFFLGLLRVGKGEWRGISRNFVKTRTPTQVASRAQKYFLRRHNQMPEIPL